QRRSSYHDKSFCNTYTPTLHDALPILKENVPQTRPEQCGNNRPDEKRVEFFDRLVLAVKNLFHDIPAKPESEHEHKAVIPDNKRSEEHTSELQSREKLVCRLLLEKKRL